MASLKQTLVEYSNVVEKVKGTSKSSNLKNMFAGSPIHSGDYTDVSVLEFYQNLLDAEGVAGYGVTNFSMNYDNNVPDLNDVEVGDPGMPASPFAPNPTSPGEGSHSALDKPAYDGVIKNPETVSNFGTGLGGLVSPSETAKSIAKSKIGEYVSGRSYQGSDGTS